MNIEAAGNSGNSFNSAHFNFKQNKVGTNKMQGGHKATHLNKTGTTGMAFASNLTSTPEQLSSLKGRIVKPLGNDKKLGIAVNFPKVSG